MSGMSASHPLTLSELRSGTQPWSLSIVLPEIGGGKATADDLAQIDAAPHATAIRLSGLDQRTFEEFVSKYGKQFVGIDFWKCPRIEDMSPLEDLPQLTHVAFYWNQRVTQLWSLRSTPRLRGLEFMDFSRLKTLDDLAEGLSLEELQFGDAIDDKNVFQSLKPLAGLPRLRELTAIAKGIADGSIHPLAQLPALRKIECSLRLFTTEQCAWLRAHLGDSVEGRILQASQRLDKPLGESSKDTFIVGKGKPFLSSSQDAGRIAKYEREFWRMVDEFRRDPAKEPAATSLKQ